MKQKILKHVFTVLLILCLMISVLPLQAHAQEQELITTRTDFEKALYGAKDGDILLVGDIDFNINAVGAVNEAERIVIDKGITVKSGKADGNAQFKGATFILNGTKVGGEYSMFVFEGITFDEGLDTGTLTDEDWLLSYDSMDELISPYPLKNQYAIECKGNTKATFTDCGFNNYMHTYGPAIRAFYGDYTMSPSLEMEHGDNAPYKLELNLNNCDFSSNAALYGGGAIYIHALDKNVTLNADGCSFTGNKSGFANNAAGGGAISAQAAIIHLTNCSFTTNEANCFYGGIRATADQIGGGAVSVSNKSELLMRNCRVCGNKASLGGGIAVTVSTASIENCTFAENKAIPEAEDKQSQYGLASNQGLGGGIYLNGSTNVTIGNTEILDNYAENALGAIFAYYDLLNDYSAYSVELLFCTIANNTCGTKMTDYIGYGEERWLWFSYYTDFFDISYLEYYCNLVIDELYESDIPKNEQASAENGYNFFGSKIPEEWYTNGELSSLPVIPTEYVKEVAGDRNYYGTFTLGANKNDSTYRFYIDDECRETVMLGAGECVVFPTFEKEGHTLTHWLLDGKEYNSNTPIVIGNATEFIELHAVFVPNVYKVTFDLGYTKTVADQTYGTEMILPEPPSKDGYSFVGWFTLPDGKGERVASDAPYGLAMDATYYAFYTPIEVDPLSKFPTAAVIVISAAVVILAGVAVWFFIYRKRNANEPIPFEYRDASATSAEAAAVPKIVKTRYTDVEIDRVIQMSGEVQKLTDRELDVFREILKGKKQGGISYYLGITVNTVKEYTKKVYSKLGVANKEELFDLIDSRLNKK